MKFFDKVFYRAAAAPLTTLPTIGGTFPTATISGWTELVGGIAEKAKIGVEPDVQDAMGDGTTNTSGEKVPVTIMVKDFTVANYGTIRSAFLNQKVDVLMFDNNIRGVVYAAHGIKLHPKLTAEGGTTPVIEITGERKVSSGATSPFQLLGT